MNNTIKYEIFKNYLGQYSVKRIEGKMSWDGSISFRTKEKAQSWINHQMGK